MSTRRSATRRLVPVLALGASVACDDDSTEPDATTEEQVAYIDQIVPHHEVASMRADEALTKAVHEGLEAMAQRMKDDQTREIAQFKQIRLELTGSDSTPPPMMPRPIPAGPEFDREWILMMVDHHQGAIHMSALAHGANIGGRLDSLAHHTMEQARERDEMMDSLAVWYP
jgi:uncharacterized protein (DUF305 family)